MMTRLKEEGFDTMYYSPYEWNARFYFMNHGEVFINVAGVMTTDDQLRPWLAPVVQGEVEGEHLVLDLRLPQMGIFGLHDGCLALEILRIRL